MVAKKKDIDPEIMFHFGQNFLVLCQQYERMGKLLTLQAEVIAHPIFNKSTALITLQKVVEQYQEVGEQLKAVGRGVVDLNGSFPLLHSEAYGRKEEAEDSKGTE